MVTKQEGSYFLIKLTEHKVNHEDSMSVFQKVFPSDVVITKSEVLEMLWFDYSQMWNSKLLIDIQGPYFIGFLAVPAEDYSLSRKI